MSEPIAPNDDQRRFRFAICRAHDAARQPIEAAPHLTEAQKTEILNLWAVALRLSLHISDGNLSLERLRTW